jgi:hypothetical protein
VEGEIDESSLLELLLLVELNEEALGELSE